MQIKLKKILSSKINLYELTKWVSWLNDKEITKYSEQRYHKHTINSQKKFLEKKIKLNKSNVFKIYNKDNFIGIIELGNIDLKNQNCEIMYFIGERNYWSKGIGTEAIKICLKHAKKLNISKVYAGVYSNNLGSIKILKKNNFKIEGEISKFYNFYIKKKKIKISKLILGLNLRT